jgi:hypothetical protein
MAHIITVRKAVKAHKCGVYRCRKWIKSGQKYLRHFYTPDELGGLATVKECPDCAAYAGRGARLA